MGLELRGLSLEGGDILLEAGEAGSSKAALVRDGHAPSGRPGTVQEHRPSIHSRASTCTFECTCTFRRSSCLSNIQTDEKMAFASLNQSGNKSQTLKTNKKEPRVEVLAPPTN